MKNLRIFTNYKKIKNSAIALATAAALSFTLAGCCDENHEEIVRQKEAEIAELESQITSLENEKAELKALLPTPTPIPTPTLMPTFTPEPTPTVVPKVPYKPVESTPVSRVSQESLDRSNRIKNSSDSLKEMYAVYDYIGDTFPSKNGQIYRRVSIPGDDGYAYGYFNMNTLKEDIPCKTYNHIGDEFPSANGQTYRKVGIPGDDMYAYGYFNMSTLKEDIPCKTYSYIGDEFKVGNGQTYIRVGVPGDRMYAYGYFNMSTLKEDIPCKTFKNIYNVEGDIYQAVYPDGTLKSYKLELSK